MKILKYTLGTLIILTVGFGLGWFFNNMSRFAQGVIDDSDRNAMFLKEYRDSVFNINVVQNDKVQTEYSNPDFLKPIVVEYAQDEFVKCDTAHSTLAINICSLEMLELELSTFDSLKNFTYKLYDSLIVEQNKDIEQWKVENEIAQLKYVTDYKSIKKLHIQSLAYLLKHIEKERDIVELEMNKARLTNYYSNRIHTQLLKEQNKKLQLLINKLRL